MQLDFVFVYVHGRENKYYNILIVNVKRGFGSTIIWDSHEAFEYDSDGDVQRWNEGERMYQNTNIFGVNIWRRYS